jgi:hypothetical protein
LSKDKLLRHCTESLIKIKWSQAWWHNTIIPAFRRLRQEDFESEISQLGLYSEFLASLGYKTKQLRLSVMVFQMTVVIKLGIYIIANHNNMISFIYLKNFCGSNPGLCAC